MKNAGLVLGIILVVVLALLLLGGAAMMGFGGFGMMRGYGGYGGMMGGFGFSPIGMIFSLVFWALLIGGAVWLVVTLARGASTGAASATGQTPLDILKVRYAKGEVTKEQFEEMKHNLGA